MRLKDKQLLLAAMATTWCFSGQVFAADVTVSDNSGSKTSSYSEWENEAGDIVVYGGGDETTTISITDRYLAINGGTFDGIFGGMTSTGNASNNQITFNNGTLSSGGIVGGFTFYLNNLRAGNVFGNKIYMNGGTVGWVQGGAVGYVGSISDFSGLSGGNVYNNEVNILGGTISGGVIGGSALTGSANENTINISGGTISGIVIGGEVQSPLSSSSARDNVINIYGSPDLRSATFYGGLLGSGYDTTGNTLNINTSGISIGHINSDSFDQINFNLPVSVVSNTDVLYMNDSSELSMEKIGITLDGRSPLSKGDTFNLVVNNMSTSADLAFSADSAPVSITASKGALMTGTVNLTSTENGITATVGEFVQSNANEVSKANDGSFAGAIIPELDPFTQAMVDSSFDNNPSGGGSGDGKGDKAASDEAVAVTDVRLVSGYNIFMNSGGGRIKTKTGGGSYIRTSRGNYDFGFARTLEGKAGRLYIAPVFERAQGHYNAVLPVSPVTGQHMHGNGSTKYTAGGFIARLLNKSGFYYEGSIRGGRSENDFASNDFIIEGEKTRVTYTMKAPVFTGHLRIGDAIRLSKNSLLDIYGIYFYTHQNGMNTTLSSGDQVSFNSVSGHTMRLGYRLTTQTSRISKVYGGLAYQYDRTSDSTATALGYRRTSEGSKGSSGMLELGWQIKPNKDVPWYVDINATGWMGRMQGFNITARAQKSF